MTLILPDGMAPPPKPMSRERIDYIRLLKRELSRREDVIGACEESLIDFMRELWPVLEPSEPFVEGWAIGGIAEHLEAVTSGYVRRLLMTVPPGFSKSLSTAVFHPVWEWGPCDLPHMRYLCFSYAEELSLRDNGRSRDLIASEEFQTLWGDRFKVNPARDAKHYYENDHRGWRYASSIGGRTTGFRGQRLIIDDPHNIKDVESETKRESAVRWFHESLPNRLAKQDRDAIIVIMQRSHESDVAGDILEKELDYVHLNIPLHYDSTRHCVTVLAWDEDGTPTRTWEDPRTEDGELAWPERFNEATIAELTKEMGPYAISGQYEQAPVPRGGGIIKREYWQLWPPDGHPERESQRVDMPPMEYIVASLDTALVAKEENDFNALTVWGVFREEIGRKQGPRLITEAGQLVSIDDSSHPKTMLMYGWQKKLALRGPTEPEDMRIAKKGCPECGAGVYAPHDERCKAYRRERQALWGVVEHTMDACRRLHVDLLLIEAQARGIDTAVEIERQIGGEEFGVQVIRPAGDKIARALAVQHLFSNGRVYAPQLWNAAAQQWLHPAWCQTIIDQVTMFPRAQHDDLVDSTTAALLHLRDTGILMRKDESAMELEDEMRYRPRLRALYDV